MESGLWLLPGGLPDWLILILLALSLFTSLLTATVGAGGGVLMLIALSLCLPPAAIIPVHGGIQLGSNIGRGYMARHHIDWGVVWRFLPGMMVGTALAGLLLIQLPQAVWQLAIALFVLYLCWAPSLPTLAGPRVSLWAMASGSGFLTMFVGATGPLIAAFLKRKFAERRVFVATVAAVLSAQHGIKGVVFGVGGFDFIPWLWFVVAMIVCGALGTWLGLQLLGKMDNHRFDRVLKIVLSVLALRLLWQALEGFGL